MKASLNTMNKSLVLCTLAVALCVAQAQTTLNPPQDRISDRAITADQAAYEQLQGRLHALNEGGRRVRDYHLSKAQCWLDVSLHEYTRNDRSAFPQEAMTESEKLILAMERKTTPLSMETPLVNGAARLRPDLWARALTLQSHAGFACAQMQAACGEVELVHAGNEHNQQQWRHAKPYVQIAEDLLAQGEAAASTCLPPVVVAPVVPPVAAPAPPPAVPQPVALSASVVFNFDRYSAGEMRAPSADSLKALMAQVKDGRLTVQKILLVGHADRMNGTGKRDYNQQLSRQRAETVRQVLTDAGLPAATMGFEYRGDSQPVAQCLGKFKSQAELQECLLPNRRVEVQLSGTRP